MVKLLIFIIFMSNVAYGQSKAFIKTTDGVKKLGMATVGADSVTISANATVDSGLYVTKWRLADSTAAIRADFPAPGGGDFIASVGQVFLSITKTNIGNAYVDIYATAFDIENLLKVDLTGADSVRLIFIWDYVGTGTQQVRIADVSNNANVLVESATFTADQDPGDSGWKVIPAAFKAVKNLEWQGKSTVAGDDPVAKGYILYVK